MRQNITWSPLGDVFCISMYLKQPSVDGLSQEVNIFSELKEAKWIWLIGLIHYWQVLQSMISLCFQKGSDWATTGYGLHLEILPETQKLLSYPVYSYWKNGSNSLNQLQIYFPEYSFTFRIDSWFALKTQSMGLCRL